MALPQRVVGFAISHPRIAGAAVLVTVFMIAFRDRFDIVDRLTEWLARWALYIGLFVLAFLFGRAWGPTIVELIRGTVL